tara:strand:+ start:199 stop:384 length:186 start_codon:yes stop_codon:yes gene_type:complete
MLQIEFLNGKVDALPIDCYGNVANARRWCKVLIFDQDIVETRLFVTDADGVENCETYRKEN